MISSFRFSIFYLFFTFEYTFRLHNERHVVCVCVLCILNNYFLTLTAAIMCWCLMFVAHKMNVLRRTCDLSKHTTRNSPHRERERESARAHSYSQPQTITPAQWMWRSLVDFTEKNERFLIFRLIYSMQRELSTIWYRITTLVGREWTENEENHRNQINLRRLRTTATCHVDILLSRRIQTQIWATMRLTQTHVHHRTHSDSDSMTVGEQVRWSVFETMNGNQQNDFTFLAISVCVCVCRCVAVYTTYKVQQHLLQSSALTLAHRTRSYC